jgi:hypothetical protein
VVDVNLVVDGVVIDDVSVNVTLFKELKKMNLYPKMATPSQNRPQFFSVK